MNIIRKWGSLMLILAISLPCFAKKKVEFKGNWHLSPKSIIPKLPKFSTNLGTVQVIVTNSAGEVVYNQSVVTKPSIGISLNEEVKEGVSSLLQMG